MAVTINTHELSPLVVHVTPVPISGGCDTGGGAVVWRLVDSASVQMGSGAAVVTGTSWSADMTSNRNVIERDCRLEVTQGVDVANHSPLEVAPPNNEFPSPAERNTGLALTATAAAPAAGGAELLPAQALSPATPVFTIDSTVRLFQSGGIQLLRATGRYHRKGGMRAVVCEVLESGKGQFYSLGIGSAALGLGTWEAYIHVTGVVVSRTYRLRASTISPLGAIMARWQKNVVVVS